MKFYPEGNEPIKIALLSGHSAVVQPDGTDLPELFHREAIAAGCKLSKGPAPKVENAAPEFNRKDVITAAMNKMLDGNNEGDFTADGKPDLRALNKYAGFQVARDERDSIWAEISAGMTFMESDE